MSERESRCIDNKAVRNMWNSYVTCIVKETTYKTARWYLERRGLPRGRVVRVPVDSTLGKHLLYGDDTL